MISIRRILLNPERDSSLYLMGIDINCLITFSSKQSPSVPSRHGVVLGLGPYTQRINRIPNYSECWGWVSILNVQTESPAIRYHSKRLSISNVISQSHLISQYQRKRKSKSAHLLSHLYIVPSLTSLGSSHWLLRPSSTYCLLGLHLLKFMRFELLLCCSSFQ